MFKVKKIGKVNGQIIKEALKNVGKYVCIYILLVAILFGIMLLTIVTIPREKIEDNIKESIPDLRSSTEVKRIKPERYDTYFHVYADEILLNMIYCMDTENPIQSMMEAKYYDDGIHPSLEGAVETQSNGNTEYIRYWHGSMTIIRPLLMFLNITQIYYLFAVILAICVITLFIMLFRKKQYILIIAMTIGLIVTSSIYVPFCLEYMWTYLIMLIATMIGIHIESKEKGNKYVRILMFITGILTCFLDFLSTETITFLIPIICIYTIRYKEKRLQDLKTEGKQILSWMFMWLIGYGIMWIAKWFLTSVILHINVLDYVTEKAMVRINGNMNENTIFATIINGLKKNFLTIYPFFAIKKPIIGWAIVISILIVIIGLAKRDKEEIKKACIVFAIGLVPYVRYLVVASHSRGHYFFTFRAQLATIMAIIVAMYIIIDKNRMKKKI